MQTYYRYKNGCQYYEQFKKSGKWVEWEKNGKEKINGIYKNDLPWKGQFENYYYSNGTIAQEYIEYYESGQKKIEGSYINNKKNGEWSEWYENGNKKQAFSVLSNFYDNEW